MRNQIDKFSSTKSQILLEIPTGRSIFLCNFNKLFIKYFT